MSGVPIALYNLSLVALIVHVASGWALGLRIAYLGFLTGAAVAVVAAVIGVIEVIGGSSQARRDAFQQHGVHLAGSVVYGTAGYLLYRSYLARAVVDGPDLGYLPALVLAAIALVGSALAGWIGWKLTHGQPADQRS